MKVLDSTFIIDLLCGDKKTHKFLRSKDVFVTTQINLFEVIIGLFFKNVSPAKFHEAMEVFDSVRLLSLDDAGIIKSAEISATLMKKGEMLPDADCLIAGIALSKGVKTIVTRNVKDFGKIKGLKVEMY